MPRDLYVNLFFKSAVKEFRFFFFLKTHLFTVKMYTPDGEIEPCGGMTRIYVFIRYFQNFFFYSHSCARNNDYAC